VNKTNPTDYDEVYAGPEYYWGKKPSATCDRVIEIFRSRLDSQPRLLDLGCGEGRDAVYFAKHGFDVTGVDTSAHGLEKTQRYAEEAGVAIKTVHADLIEYEPESEYDVIFSTGTLHNVPLEVRVECLERYKEATSASGINALGVFVKKPFIAQAPDFKERPAAWTHWQSGELMGYYWDWEIMYSTEEIFDCMSSGVPHKHACNRLVARRYHQADSGD